MAKKMKEKLVYYSIFRFY